MNIELNLCQYQQYLINHIKQSKLFNAAVLSEAHWLTTDELEDAVLSIYI